MKKKILIIFIVIDICVFFGQMVIYFNKKSLINEKINSLSKAESISSKVQPEIINKIVEQNNIEKFRIFYQNVFIEADSKEVRNKIKNIISSSNIWGRTFSEINNSLNKNQSPIFYIKLINTNSNSANQSVENYQLSFNVKNKNGEPISQNVEKFNYELPLNYENANLEILIYSAGLDIFLKDISTLNFHVKEKILIDKYKIFQNEEKILIEKVLKDYADKGFFNSQYLLLQNEKININIEINGEDKVINMCKDLIKRNFIWHVLLKNNIVPIKIDIQSDVILEDKKKYILDGFSYIPGTAHVIFSVIYNNGSNQVIESKHRTPASVVSNEDPYTVALENAMDILLVDLAIDLYSTMSLIDQSTFFKYLICELTIFEYNTSSHKKLEQLILNCILQSPKNIEILIPGIGANNFNMKYKCSRILTHTFKETRSYVIEGLNHSNFEVKKAIADLLRSVITSNDKKNKITLFEEEKEKILRYLISILNDKSYDIYYLKSFMFLLDELNVKTNEIEKTLKRIISINKNNDNVETASRILQKFKP